MDVKTDSDIFREPVLQVSKKCGAVEGLAFGLKMRLSGLASRGRTAGAAGLYLAVQFGIIMTLFKRILMCHEEGIKLD